MIRHLLKLVWHRKGANALIMLEIFASFLIVFFVATLGISLWSRWRTPLGFDWHNVLVMSVVTSSNREISSSHSGPDADRGPDTSHARANDDDVRRVLDELRAFPQVETTARDSMPPYSHRTWTTVLQNGGRSADVTGDHANDEFARTMRLQVISGRWFTREDEAANYQPLVLDADAAKALFGNENAVGKRLPDASRYIGDGAPKDLMVVGVIAPYRKDGEFTATKLNMAFFRTSQRFPPLPEASQVLIRVREGTPAAFEAELNERLRPDASGVKFRVRRMDDMRNGALRLALTPVAALTIIAMFLIVMVALGLTGVLWQTVTRRTREIGLRRAVGASRAGVRQQVLGELAVIVTLAVIVAMIIIAQLPLLGVFAVATPADFAWGVATALAAIYGITLLCGAYPSWLASTIQPAEALHYE